MEAWQKLIRVLTHEIMNSITPIISLSDTLSCNIQNKEWAEENLLLLNQGLQTIHRRSKGLLNFVENYRKLTRIPSPILSPISISDLLNNIKKLYSNLPIIYNIEDPNHILLIDRIQIEQVLINLIKNATEACSDQPLPQIKISTFFLPDSKLFTLTISDNGCGILPEVIDKIFVPFFTTKPTGSGIGLSLCKQIINLHGGKITVESKANKGTTFTLKFIE
jgi:Signal transduction histidine kinase regulating C4-dicarboxylate transport system